jgi:hypothetical protein
MYELTLTFFGNKSPIVTKFKTLEDAKFTYDYAREYHGKGLKGGRINFPLPGSNNNNLYQINL